MNSCEHHWSNSSRNKRGLLYLQARAQTKTDKMRSDPVAECGASVLERDSWTAVVSRGFLQLFCRHQEWEQSSQHQIHNPNHHTRDDPLWWHIVGGIPTHTSLTHPTNWPFCHRWKNNKLKLNDHFKNKYEFWRVRMFIQKYGSSLGKMSEQPGKKYEKWQNYQS